MVNPKTVVTSSCSIGPRLGPCPVYRRHVTGRGSSRTGHAMQSGRQQGQQVSRSTHFDGAGRPVFDGWFGACGRPGPRRARGCRRAHGRQGRCAPPRRWPGRRAILDSRCARRLQPAQVGTEGWSRRTKGCRKTASKRCRACLASSCYRFRRAVERAGSGSGKCARRLDCRARVSGRSADSPGRT
jgi:hypothetical protein